MERQTSTSNKSPPEMEARVYRRFYARKCKRRKLPRIKFSSIERTSAEVSTPSFGPRYPYRITESRSYARIGEYETIHSSVREFFDRYSRREIPSSSKNVETSLRLSEGRGKKKNVSLGWSVAPRSAFDDVT